MWLLGDVFNIVGAVLQGVLPTMLILAVYYTVADVVLLAQCFYYRGFTWRDEVVAPPPKPTRVAMAPGEPNERTGLLDNNYLAQRERRGSNHSWSNLSPVVPLVNEPPAASPPTPTRLQAFLWNTIAVLMVIVAGVAGWFMSRRYTDGGGHAEPVDEGLPQFNVLGQVFGWLCAVFYLGSRLPQILLNFRRKSTEGVSMLFFLFACLGNLTYVLSILAYEPKCAHKHCAPGEAARIYGRYILVNASWLAGSLGTLCLDLGIFIQFFIYSEDDGSAGQEDVGFEDDEEAADVDEDRWDQRPVLQRLGSGNA